MNRCCEWFSQSYCELSEGCMSQKGMARPQIFWARVRGVSREDFPLGVRMALNFFGL